jgi:hypothetical protein
MAMRGNGRKPQRAASTPTTAAVNSSAEAVLDDVLYPSASRITSPLGFPLLPVVIGYGFLLYVMVAMLASMATFHEEQVMVLGGKIYLGSVVLALLFTLGGWAAEIAARQVAPSSPDDPAVAGDGTSP